MNLAVPGEFSATISNLIRHAVAPLRHRDLAQSIYRTARHGKTRTNGHASNDICTHDPTVPAAKTNALNRAAGTQKSIS
jgi:hypothetical protein